VIERWGRLDVLVNNAGAGAIMPLAEVNAERVRDIFAVNVLGPSLLTKEALPHLKERKGSIINISSTYGSKAGAGLSPLWSKQSRSRIFNPRLGSGTGSNRHTC
jgi:NAD(P)-dependent dehydrogenase (short-subunit alcohol dehydrogenase family)